MKAIFVTVIVERAGKDTDISDRISDLSYDRDFEKENSMSLTIEQSYLEKISDLPLRKGDRLLVQYGYKGGQHSQTHKVRVTDLERNYIGRKVQLKIKGRDEGTLIKKTTSVEVWTDKTLSQIASIIAQRYGLSYQEDEPTTYIYPSLPQAQKDDWGFLQSIVSMEKGGEYLCYIEDGILFLKRMALQSDSIYTIDYANGSNLSVSRIKIKETESQSNAKQSASKSVVGFDMDKAEALQETANDEQTDSESEEGLGSFDGVLGDYATEFSGNSKDIEEPANSFGGAINAVLNTQNSNGQEFDANGEPLIGNSFGGAINAVLFPNKNGYGDRQVVPLSSKEELQGAASTGKKVGTIKRKELELELEGLPLVSLNQIITLIGVCPEDIGNYLVKSIKDKVGSTYTTTLTCWKNASKVPSKDGQIKSPTKSQNKTVGEDIGTDIPTKEILFFDANGEPIK